MESLPDGEINKDLKPMSKEDFEFLQNALDEVIINEMKEIFKRLDIIKTNEIDESNEDQVQSRLIVLEELDGFLDGLENAKSIFY